MATKEKYRNQHQLKMKIPGHTDYIYLDELCWSCNSPITGKDHGVFEEDGSCSICGDFGFVLTDAGKALLEFVKQWGKAEK